MATYRSNANIDNEDMADITDWTDGDFGGESTQVTFDSKSCMRLYATGIVASAKRTQDIGTFGDRTVFSMNMYFDTIAALAITNFEAYNGSYKLGIQFTSAGISVYNGTNWIEVGTNLVVADTWQEWTFDVDWTTQTVDVYLDQELVGSDVSCADADTIANGTVNFGATIVFSTVITYIDWFKAGDDFITSGQVIMIGE